MPAAGRWGVWFAGIMSPAKPCEPSLVRDGLAVYRIGRGEPVLVMPGPHRFERPGLRAAYAALASTR